MYLRSADVILYFVNLNEADGLQVCEDKMDLCRNFENIPSIVIGNHKQNWNRRISQEDAREFAIKHKAPYYECCVATREGF